ncbi:lanosterol synthase [Catenaria anguillulae PL171]|uniref:Terpene cyclase/mutase family member n=1 Tax=Catenaria anguillulae PL171 TaxID=765915 RepID=A0A1Y2HP42_9FUNG|nr:lanosterol synthase [Catenaria anguillulae PL171]
MVTPYARAADARHFATLALPTAAATDLNRWRLRVDDGRQWWEYLESPSTRSQTDDDPQTDVERHHLNLLHPLTSDAHNALPTPSTLSDAVANAFHYMSRTQTADGHFACEYGGPMFLIPGLVIAWYISGCRTDLLPDAYRIEMVRYLRTQARPEGGWGIHIESPATVFGTALNYVALRLMGVPATDPVAVKARAWLHSVPGAALGVPSWGKFWLASLGLYDWEGMNPVPLELWLLPEWLPFHPWRMWVHTRMVYLPMGYLYGQRLTYAGDALIDALREELYSAPYAQVDWKAQRSHVAEVDRYVPESKLGNFVWWVVGKYESVHNAWLRKRALRYCLDLIHNEDDNTMSLDIGPVNKAMHLLAVYHADGPESQRFKDHVATVRDFMWMSQGGMMMNGTNGVQLWDTAFLCQAGYEANLHTHPSFRPMFSRALHFLDTCQIRHNAPFNTFRHQSKGAWPFSNRQQSYTVSDCTAEGLKAVLQLQSTLGVQPVAAARLCDAVDVLLSMPNSDGGFASYEKIRGPALLEVLNPAEVFGNIMIEYSYPECTTASVLGLLAFLKYTASDYRAKDVQRVVQRALKYIRAVQEPATGAWYGAWGVCYTYATWFAVESLCGAGGGNYSTSPEIRRACDFIASKQFADGGWGESYKSCEVHAYVPHPQGSQVVQTAWAVLLLMRAEYTNEDVIRRGVELIATRQLANGAWSQEGIEGVFNKNCTISYPNYKLYFSAWALARYAKTRGDPKVVRVRDGEVKLVLGDERQGRVH